MGHVAKHNSERRSYISTGNQTRQRQKKSRETIEKEATGCKRQAWKHWFQLAQDRSAWSLTKDEEEESYVNLP